MKSRVHNFGIKISIFFVVAAATTGLFWIFSVPTPSVQAATCPFIDNDANDANGAVGTYQLNTNFTVASAATAYDCTSAAGITTFIVPIGVTLTLDSNTATGAIAQVNFTNLTVNSGGIVSANQKGCSTTTSTQSFGPNGSNVCTSGAAGSGGNTSNGTSGAGGAGHGGAGGAGAGATPGSAGGTYGSATAPLLFGSSGGSANSSFGGTGGGLVRLNITGTFTHNGLVSANGGIGISGGGGGNAGGGGSGGSVSVTAGTMAGTTGTFEAKGGAGGNGVTSYSAGGGGGGRVSVVLSAVSGWTPTSGTFDVSGGANGTGGGGSTAGGKGTVYVVNDQGTGPATDDVVTIYHGFTYTDTDFSVASWVTDASATGQTCDPTIAGSATPSVSATTITLGGTLNCTQSTTSFIFSATGTLAVSASASLTVNSALTLSGGTGFSIGSGATVVATKINTDMTFTIPAGVDQTWTNVTVNGPAEGDLLISSAIAITFSGTTSVNANVQWTNLTNLTIPSGTSIVSNQKGCSTTTSAQSFGPNGSNVCTSGAAGSGGNTTNGTSGAGGAGHGGAGGAGGGVTPGSAGGTYGSATAPLLFGSSGGSANSSVGGTGGGLIRLNVTGTFTHNGLVSANGGTGISGGGGGNAGGGGSGGSVYLTVGTMAGTTGTFEAKGGVGGNGVTNYSAGGGAGGRVSVVHSAVSGWTPTSATFDVSGGANGTGGGTSTAGGKGTAYVNNTTANTVQIFHGFTYTDTDYSFTTWTFDGSATNQYCDATISTGATPSITTTNALAFNGTFNCAKIIASFTFSSAAGVSSAASSVINVPGAVTLTTSAGALAIGASASVISAGALVLSGNTSFSIGSNAIITDSTVNTDMTFTIPAGVDQTWTNVTINGPAEGDLLISSAVAITLSGTTSVNANVQWTNLTNLTIDSGNSIVANAKGCTTTISADSFGPNGSNACTNAGSGRGGNTTNGTSGAGGAGHGGAGGAGAGATPGSAGGTYDSLTVPAFFGASGGSANSSFGGAGGGLVRLNVTGTFTHNGLVSANGGTGISGGGGGNAGGGGSGGSVYLTAGTVAGTSGTFEAKGGTGGNGVTSYSAGGGGGGRVSVEYATDTSSFLSGLTAASVATGGANGSGGGGSSPGATGTLNLTNTNPPPVVTIVTHSPASPFTTDPVTLSGTATDNAGIVKIEIFLDGTAPANLKHTCNIAPTTPATCSINIGTLSGGSHTTTIRAYDAALQMAQGTENFSVGGSTTAGQMILGRSKVGTSTSFTLVFALSGTSTGTLTVTFPVQFTVTAAGSGGASSGCLSSFGFTSTTLTATKTACSGTVTLGGATITNPGTPGTYVINWTNDSGSGSVYITSDDQVGVSANVDPVLIFNVGSQASATACDGTFAGNGGTIALGVIGTGAVTSSDAASVAHICTRVTTNGTLGANITVKSLNASLKSTSTPADAIPSATTTLAPGTAGYGLCAGSAGGDSGKDTTVPVGATPTRSAPFNGASCTSTGHDIGALTTSAQTLWTLASASQNAFFRLYIKAAVSPTTPAHNDYTDTLTFVATGTY